MAETPLEVDPPLWANFNTFQRSSRPVCRPLIPAADLLWLSAVWTPILARAQHEVVDRLRRNLVVRVVREVWLVRDVGDDRCFPFSRQRFLRRPDATSQCLVRSQHSSIKSQHSIISQHLSAIVTSQHFIDNPHTRRNQTQATSSSVHIIPGFSSM